MSSDRFVRLTPQRGHRSHVFRSQLTFLLLPHRRPPLHFHHGHRFRLYLFALFADICSVADPPARPQCKPRRKGDVSFAFCRARRDEDRLRTESGAVYGFSDFRVAWWLAGGERSAAAGCRAPANERRIKRIKVIPTYVYANERSNSEIVFE